MAKKFFILLIVLIVFSWGKTLPNIKKIIRPYSGYILITSHLHKNPKCKTNIKIYKTTDFPFYSDEDKKELLKELNLSCFKSEKEIMSIIQNTINEDKKIRKLKEKMIHISFLILTLIFIIVISIVKSFEKREIYVAIYLAIGVICFIYLNISYSYSYKIEKNIDKKYIQNMDFKDAITKHNMFSIRFYINTKKIFEKYNNTINKFKEIVALARELCFYDLKSKKTEKIIFTNDCKIIVLQNLSLKKGFVDTNIFFKENNNSSIYDYIFPLKTNKYLLIEYFPKK